MASQGPLDGRVSVVGGRATLNREVLERVIPSGITYSWELQLRWRITGLLHHHRKSMNIKELRIRTWVNASDCPARSYAQSVAPGAVSSLLQATYVDQEKQRKSCPYKDLCLYC